ncbi:pyruvate dehydrogenase complex dihydrolipoamide acetyltransferase [Radiomyces spectabilis]|uniref:pyruvate dehydrogenase complex dihydrolipoamide acetyltransferase n=1 Tax=Radiomyces spectabilis TaxID=64574 RepID=UPI00221E5D9C|nr:pyruvate dehydrogenase complex dihydrolipoamide acetyltransferase [Radiomyces spectabilis]KAI8371789.1 pyruvate dehydrogenase complex dihydrolipoamide acetyltransferase [Radiomyces spectabilis]
MSSARRQLFRAACGLSSSARLSAARTSVRAVPLLNSSVRAFSATSNSKFTALRAMVNLNNEKDIRFYSSKSFPSHNVIAMPALSPTMTAGGIGAFQKKVGDEMQPGDVLLEIETDKAQMDFECQEEGFIAKFLVQEGDKDVPVGKPIAILVEDEGDVAAFENFTLEDASSGQPAKEESPATKESPAEAEEAAPAAPGATAAAPAASSASAASGDRIKASPLAQKMANERNIDLSQVQGTGPNGRIVKSDIEGFKGAPAAAQTQAAPKAAAQPAPAAYTPQGAAGDAFTDIPTSNMRKIIGSRLQESKQTVPHYYLTVEIGMDKVNKLRQVLNNSAEGKYKLSVNDFIVKASALSLKKVPEVNAAWQGDFIRQYNTADVCVAVATPTGLITPIVANAESKGLSSISAQVKDMATRARNGKLAPHEYQGGSFTISNLGMFGIKHFTAIINPPQSCILAIGGTQKKVVADETQESGFAVRDVMEVTLSADHRVVDGAVGATWLQAFKEYMENPLKMML